MLKSATLTACHPAALHNQGQTGDALLDAVRAYRNAMEDFNQNAPRDDAGAAAYVKVSYGPALQLLDHWTKPAGSVEGAIEALKISLDDERGLHGCDTADRMIKAALLFLEANRSAFFVDSQKILAAEDAVYECVHLARLISNSIEALQADADLRALSTGINIVEKRLRDAGDWLDTARR